MPIKTDTQASQLELWLDLALQTHHALFESLHAEVRQASLDCDKARQAFSKRRRPVRGGAHYRLPAATSPTSQIARPARERDTTLPMHRLVG